jgi:hypothetical protein
VPECRNLREVWFVGAFSEPEGENYGALFTKTSKSLSVRQANPYLFAHARGAESPLRLLFLSLNHA